MRADNTSAFNCRPVTGNPYRVSQHSYGNAIDINTVRNPYVVGSRVFPGFARTYLRPLPRAHRDDHQRRRHRHLDAPPRLAVGCPLEPPGLPALLVQRGLGQPGMLGA